MILFSLKIVFVLANSVDPDEMLHYAAFHLGLHCLPKYHFGVTSVQRVKEHYSCSVMFPFHMRNKFHAKK